MTRTSKILAAVTIVAAALSQAPLFAHHSFAMYDQNKTLTITGVVKQYVPQANHAEFHLYVIAADRKGLEKGKDGKPLEFMVEMAGTAQLERQGVTAQSFPVGTVISVKVNPLRDGGAAGARVSPLARCPEDSATKKPKLPEAGKHCDSVAGRTLNGGETF
jgi:Family of unknown function (DUF6152)